MLRERFASGGAILTSLCFFTLPALQAQAPAGDCEGARAQISSLQSKIEVDKRAIRSLGFEQRSEDIEDWEKLSGEARAKFMSDTFDMLLASAQVGVKTAGTLNPPSANRAISRLRAAGINVQPLNDAIRKLAATPGKTPKAADINDFLDGISKGKDSISLANTGGDSQSRLEALSTVLGWFQTSPSIAVLAADLQFTTSSIYNNATRRVSQNQIEQLTRLNETNLKSLKRLSDQLRTDVGALNAAKQVATSCSENLAATTEQTFAGNWIFHETGELVVISGHAGSYRMQLNGIYWSLQGSESNVQAKKQLNGAEVHAIHPELPSDVASNAAGLPAVLAMTLAPDGQTITVALVVPGVGWSPRTRQATMGAPATLTGTLTRVSKPQ
jgi:hypothetical protein